MLILLKQYHVIDYFFMNSVLLLIKMSKKYTHDFTYLIDVG